MRVKAIMAAAVALMAVIPCYGVRPFDVSVGLGYNIGATTPLGLPATVRSIGNYSPGANLSLSIEGVRMISGGWGIGAGVSFDNLGQQSGIKTRNYHLTMDIVDGSETGTRTGYYTGKIKNETKLSYLTIPVYAVLRPCDKWQADAGVYVAFALNRSFVGNVSEGQMREDPLHPLIAIKHAEYDYSSDMRRFDTGLRVGASMRVWRGLSVRASLRWGLLSVLNQSTRKIDMDTYNIYLNLGVAYTL